MCLKDREWYHGSICQQWNTMFLCQLRQTLYVCYKQLRIGDDLEEECTGLVIDYILNLLKVSEIYKTSLHTQSTQRVAHQGNGIAKQMF